MARPPELPEHQHGLDARGACLFQDLIVGNIVLPMNSHDGTQTPLVELFKQLNLLPVEDPRFRPTEKVVTTTALYTCSLVGDRMNSWLWQGGCPHPLLLLYHLK
jgi:hypothetical protein